MDAYLRAAANRDRRRAEYAAASGLDAWIAWARYRGATARMDAAARAAKATVPPRPWTTRRMPLFVRTQR